MSTMSSIYMNKIRICFKLKTFCTLGIKYIQWLIMTYLLHLFIYFIFLHLLCNRWHKNYCKHPNWKLEIISATKCTFFHIDFIIFSPNLELPLNFVNDDRWWTKHFFLFFKQNGINISSKAIIISGSQPGIYMTA